MEPTIRLTVLVRKEEVEGDPWWVGRCLEYDLVCQARTPKGVVEELGRALAARVVLAARKHLSDPLSLLRPAPESVRAEFERTRGRSTPLPLPEDLRELHLPNVPLHVGFQAQLQP